VIITVERLWGTPGRTFIFYLQCQFEKWFPESGAEFFNLEYRRLNFPKGGEFKIFNAGS
jgi:hypothetical protein